MSIPTPPQDSFGRRCFDAFLAAGLVKADTPKKMAIIAIIDGHYAKEKPKKAVSRGITGKTLTDEEWMASLEQNPALSGVAVRDEIRKCCLWADTKYGQRPSRMRIVNWLNNAPRTLGKLGAVGGNKGLDPYQEPESGWRGVAIELYPGSPFAEEVRDGKLWKDVSLTTRQKILQNL